MKTSSSCSLILLGLLSGLSSAWPVFRSPTELAKRAPQSYSVVAVDGGSTAISGTAAATKTVTDAVTQTSVVVSTIIATISDSPQTITFATTIIQTQTPSQATVTVEPTLSAYDDGQWHTTYYFKATSTPVVNANNVATTSTSSSAPPATTNVDPGQWAAWSGQNNGQYNG